MKSGPDPLKSFSVLRHLMSATSVFLRFLSALFPCTSYLFFLSLSSSSFLSIISRIIALITSHFLKHYSYHAVQCHLFSTVLSYFTPFTIPHLAYEDGVACIVLAFAIPNTYHPPPASTSLDNFQSNHAPLVPILDGSWRCRAVSQPIHLLLSSLPSLIHYPTLSAISLWPPFF